MPFRYATVAEFLSFVVDRITALERGENDIGLMNLTFLSVLDWSLLIFTVIDLVN